MADVTFDRVDATGVEARAAMTSYFAELDARFPGGFDAAGAFADDAGIVAPPGGAFVVVRDGDDGRVVGCGGLQRIDDTTAEIKRMWIDASVRGRRLGRRLLDHLEATAAALGYGRVVLDTNATLTEAIAMYTSAGYEPTERYNDNPYAQRWFTKRLGRP